jgi:hypothetical protein
MKQRTYSNTEDTVLKLLQYTKLSVTEVSRLGGINLLNTMNRLTKRNLVQYKKGRYEIVNR